MGQKSKSKKRRPLDLRSLERREQRAAVVINEHVAASTPSSMQNWFFAATLVGAVFLVYQPAWHGGFIWDDDLHLLNNDVLKTGGVARAWTEPGNYINYWPLTFTVYRLEFEAWGLNLLGFHLVNIALHAGAALLVWRVLVELNMPGAMVAAAIFALHPVNVESVAWIAQLKGLLSLLLALVSSLVYLQFDRRGGRWRYAAALSAFGLSTLAKGMVITLPIVLLACVWWRRGKIERRDLMRILPYVLIGAIMTVVELMTQQQVQGRDVVRADSLPGRVAGAGCAVWFYLGKLLWPLNLCFVYPRWKIDDGKVLWYLPGLLLVLLFALALRQRQSWGRPVVMLIVCYVALLLPALGFVNVYYMRYSLVADHYQYAAMAVACAAMGVAAAWTFRQPGFRAIACCLSLSLLVALARLTWVQCGMYADIETLYRTTIDRNPDCWFVQNNLGFRLANRGKIEEAIALYQRALEINPEYAEAHNNLGLALASQGKIDEAIAHYRTALEIDSDYAEAHNNLGLELTNRKMIEEAIFHYRRALKIKPDYFEAHNNLGAALAGCGQTDEAIVHYQKALQMKPDSAEVHNNFGRALVGLRRMDEAISHYRKVLQIRPDSAEAHYNLGVALVGRKIDEAIDHYRRAVEIQPDYLEAHFNLGLALADCGKPEDAIDHLQRAYDLAIARKDKPLGDGIQEQINKLQEQINKLRQ